LASRAKLAALMQSKNTCCLRFFHFSFSIFFVLVHDFSFLFLFFLFLPLSFSGSTRDLAKSISVHLGSFWCTMRSGTVQMGSESGAYDPF
jgi:hypothetical protein